MHLSWVIMPLTYTKFVSLSYYHRSLPVYIDTLVKQNICKLFKTKKCDNHITPSKLTHMGTPVQE